VRMEIRNAVAILAESIRGPTPHAAPRRFTGCGTFAVLDYEHAVIPEISLAAVLAVGWTGRHPGDAPLLLTGTIRAGRPLRPRSIVVQPSRLPLQPRWLSHPGPDSAHSIFTP